MMRSLTLSLILCLGLFIHSPANAEDMVPAKTLTATVNKASVVDMPVTNTTTPEAKSEYPMIRLTPDKLEVVRFDQDAVSVLVGSPKHLNMVLDTPRTAVLIPREPGSTTFTVLNARGEVVMERHVIIASPKQDYVRVRRSCANSDSKDCKEYSVFFCPDMCHKVAVQQDVDPNRVVDVPDVAPAGTGAIVEEVVTEAPVQDPSLPPPPPAAEPAVDANSKPQ